MGRSTRAWAPLGLVLVTLGCGRAVVTAEDLGDAERRGPALAQLLEAGDLETGLVGRLPGDDRDRTAPPLVWAVAGGADLEQVRALLDAGAPVDGRDDRGATALIHAAGSREPALVRLLFEAGADVDARDLNQQGVFDAARANPPLKADPLYAELYAAQTGGSRHSTPE